MPARPAAEQPSGASPAAKPRKPLALRLPDPESVQSCEPTPVPPKPTVQKVGDAIEKQLEKLGPQFVESVFYRVEGAEVWLSGRVNSPYERMVVLYAIRKLEVVERVHDQLQQAAAKSGNDGPDPWAWARHPGWKYAGWSLAAVVVLSLGVWALPQAFAKRQLAAIPVDVLAVAKGQPAVGAYLQFFAAGNGADVVGQGRIGPDGRIQWTTARGPGLPPGEYVATAVWSRMIEKDMRMVMGPNILPEGHGSPNSSPLRIKVPESTGTAVKLELLP